MATVNCYSGPNPVDDEQRREIWAWAKENAIDKGMNYDQVHKAINDEYWGGMGRPEWISDILSGRKTPYQQIAEGLWKKQYNRQTIVRQAEDLSKLHNLGITSKVVRGMWSFPRTAAVYGHGLVYPVTHAGDLLLKPEAWGIFFRNTARAYGTVMGKGRFARAAAIRRNLEGDSLFSNAARAGVDVKADSRPSGLINFKYGQTNMSDRVWEGLKLMRFELWKQEREQYIKPGDGKSSAEILDIEKKLAKWANHATGSALNPLAIGPLKAGDVFFGPKLTASKLARVFADPLETLKTFANWNKASAGDKVVAFTRFKGLAQAFGTLMAGLTVNKAYNQFMKTGQDVNVTDPMKSDFLAFKGFGLEGTIPGVTSEVRAFGKMIATIMMSDDKFVAWARKHGEQYPSRESEFFKEGGRYAMSKLSPTLNALAEIPFKESATGVPMPWSPKPGKPGYFQRMDTLQYLISHAPIPASGPVGWLYNKYRNQGLSAFDTANVIRGLLMFGFGLPGFHVHEEPEQAGGGQQSTVSAPVISSPPAKGSGTHHRKKK